MSYCAIITFKDGLPHEECEFRNAWGGAARIWTALFDKYLKNPNVPCHSWISSDQQPLWDLAKNKSLPLFERAVHASTFDLAYIGRYHFQIFCDDLRRFDEAYPSGDCISHLRAWADKISCLQVDAIGFHGTSVSENPWNKRDEAKESTEPVPLADGFEVYEWLNSSEF